MGEVRRHFHDHQEEVWKKLSEELGGEFVDRAGWRHDKVLVEHGGWKVELDVGAHVGYRLRSLYTRFRTQYPNLGELHLRVFHQELAHRIARLLGMQDVEVGDPDFDRAFVVQGSDERLARHLFEDGELRRLMLAEPHLEVTLRKAEEFIDEDIPPGSWELCLEVPGRVEDSGRLRRLYDIFSALLGQLCRLDPACPGPGGRETTG